MNEQSCDFDAGEVQGLNINKLGNVQGGIWWSKERAETGRTNCKIKVAVKGKEGGKSRWLERKRFC